MHLKDTMSYLVKDKLGQCLSGDIFEIIISIFILNYRLHAQINPSVVYDHSASQSNTLAPKKHKSKKTENVYC
jgi:hypothetical protein